MVPTYALNAEVLDGAGERVYRCQPKGNLRWQGTDRHGRRLPDGIYFIRARGQQTSEVLKVLLAR
jgi:flagellar hook assembly protein FlgD